MEIAKTIRAVTLDVGGTLIEPWPSVGHVYAASARPFGLPDIDPVALSQAFGDAWKERREFDYSRTAWRRLVDRTFAVVPGFAVSDNCFDAIYDGFARAAAWRIYDDVRPFFEWARSQRVRLAVVSNWDDRLPRLLEDLSLSAAFEALIVSHEVGHHKPAREIFLQAAGRLGLAPEEILHVGDSESEDFAGARLAGLRSCWLCRTSTGEEPIGAIRSLADVPLASN
jgi:putative hydrolase of the HAD superfamily